jgi:hypothetical protein
MRDDLVEYFQEYPNILGLAELKPVRRCFFQQNDYHGVLFIIVFDDNSEKNSV